MFDKLLNNLDSKNQLPSVITDPFLKDKIEEIYIHFRIKWSGKPMWNAWVSFKNGNTSGKQNTPDCEDFDEVIIELKKIFESIKSSS